MLAFNYHDFKKNKNPNVHVKVFNSAIKTNAKSFEEYIITTFNYTLRDTTLD